MTAALIDDTLGGLSFMLKQNREKRLAGGGGGGGCGGPVAPAGPAFTVQLEISYKKIVPAGAAVVVEATIESIEGRKMWLAARVLSGGVLGEEAAVEHARARALFVVPRDWKPPAAASEEEGEGEFVAAAAAAGRTTVGAAAAAAAAAAGAAAAGAAAAACAGKADCIGCQGRRCAGQLRRQQAARQQEASEGTGGAAIGPTAAAASFAATAAAWHRPEALSRSPAAHRQHYSQRCGGCWCSAIGCHGGATRCQRSVQAQGSRHIRRGVAAGGGRACFGCCCCSGREPRGAAAAAATAAAAAVGHRGGCSGCGGCAAGGAWRQHRKAVQGTAADTANQSEGAVW